MWGARKYCNQSHHAPTLTCSVSCQTFQMGPQLGLHHQWRCKDNRHGQTEVVLHCDWMPALPPQGWFWNKTHNSWLIIHQIFMQHTSTTHHWNTMCLHFFPLHKNEAKIFLVVRQMFHLLWIARNNSLKPNLSEIRTTWNHYLRPSPGKMHWSFTLPDSTIAA